MPEEVNRIVTDAISDWFFVTEPSGLEHLRREGKPAERVHEVGHVMVDNLFYQAAKLERMDATRLDTFELKLRHPRYGVVTLHRPSNVDDPVVLGRIMSALSRISKEIPLFFPVHPRTRNNLARFAIDVGIESSSWGRRPIWRSLTSGKTRRWCSLTVGVSQEETTALGVPCMTIRENTERPITVDEGANVLAGTNPELIIALALERSPGEADQARGPTYGTARPLCALSRYLRIGWERDEHERIVATRATHGIDGVRGGQPEMEETLKRSSSSLKRANRTSTWLSMSTSSSRRAPIPKLRGIINQCSLINADGMPVVWASRLLGKPLKERVAGVDLFEALMRRSAQTGWRIYLLGARKKSCRKSSRCMKQSFQV